MHIGLVTSVDTARLTPQDRLLQETFSQQGITAEPVVWSTASRDWSRFEGLIIRSCWDYHLRIREFLSWVELIEAQQIPLFNTPDTIRWNYNKRYLKHLQSAGFKVIPSLWFDSQERPDLPAVMRTRGWKQLVIKPLVGATAHRTLKLNYQQAADLVMDGHAYPQGFMVQKFIEEVQTQGEWSLVFLGGQYSHAVLKQPKPGDFRTQSDFGGRQELKEPDPAMISQCQPIVQFFEKIPLYARIDGVLIKEEFVLMEVELIEPELYLFTAALCLRLVKALIEALDRGF